MSAIFSYEIDERNLRVQLKNLEVPLKEEAWQKFDAFAKMHGQMEPTPIFNQIQFKLNRNVVMPAIFGTIILVFSFMLYNFVSIKKDKIQSPEPVASSNPTVNPAVAVESSAPAPEIKKPQQVTAAAVPSQPETPVVTEIVQTASVPAVAENGSEKAVTMEKNRQRRLEKATLSALKPTVITEEEAEAEIPQ